VGEIYLVRHGQASFGDANYDQLSATGEKQAAILGDHWRKRELTLDAVFSGDLQRQIDTAERAMHAAGLAHKPRIIPELNEFTISPILETYEQQLKQQDPPVTVDWSALKRDRRAVYQFLEAALRAWTREELSDPRIEPRSAFRQRCQYALEQVIALSGTGKTVAAFSSSGTISTMVSLVLGADDETAVGLELQMYNASVSRILYSDERVSLVSLNNIGHLEIGGEHDMITFI